MTDTTHWTDPLRAIGACAGAIKWCRSYENPQAAWYTCERGDWMLWIAAHFVDRKTVVLAACECARLALPFATGETHRVAENVIATTEAWARGEVTIGEVEAATIAARSGDHHAIAAAFAAATAVGATYATAETNDEFAKTLRECAAIVRRHIPNAPPLDGAGA